MEDFYKVDLSLLKVEYRQCLRMIRRVSAPLIEQIPAGDAQTVLRLSSRASVKCDKL